MPFKNIQSTHFIYPSTRQTHNKLRQNNPLTHPILEILFSLNKAEPYNLDIFGAQIFFQTKNFYGPTVFFGPKISFGPKIFWTQNLFPTQIFF